jgi:hypothetical protein
LAQFIVEDHSAVPPSSGTAQQENEESMNRAIKFAVVVGMGLIVTSWGVAQAQDNSKPVITSVQEKDASVSVAIIPADQQPTKEQLNKLFELMRVRDQLASVTKMMPALMQQQMQAQMQQMQKDHPEMATMSDEQQQAAAKVMGKFMTRVFDVYNADEMIADMAGIYQRHLTRSDVDGMIAFYSSSAGQHMVEMVPIIMQEYMPMVMQRMQERMKPLINEMTKEMEAITKPAVPSVDKPTTK